MSCVDDFEAIRRRAEEIKAEGNLALTGSTLEEAKPIGEVSIGWPYFATTDYDLPTA